MRNSRKTHLLITKRPFFTGIFFNTQKMRKKCLPTNAQKKAQKMSPTNTLNAQKMPQNRVSEKFQKNIIRDEIDFLREIPEKTFLNYQEARINIS